MSSANHSKCLFPQTTPEVVATKRFRLLASSPFTLRLLRVLHSCDFSQLPQMESLLAGYQSLHPTSLQSMEWQMKVKYNHVWTHLHVALQVECQNRAWGKEGSRSLQLKYLTLFKMLIVSTKISKNWNIWNEWYNFELRLKIWKWTWSWQFSLSGWKMVSQWPALQLV